ncbi:MAG TPA: hypothetical protein VIL97_05605 [Thermoanaerobaculia bacterium]
MPVTKFRSIDEMRPMWRDAEDPENLRDIAMMMALDFRVSPPLKPGVRRFRSLEDANDDRGDPLRQARPDLFPPTGGRRSR